MFAKNWGEPMGAPAIFEKQIEIKLLHPASTLESRIQVSINGFNSYNDPLTLSLTFVNYDSHWVIDYRLIDYLNDETEFSSKARCLR
ncbi:MAG: hypothetical protein P8X89_05160 [Reinekea sp.]